MHIVSVRKNNAAKDPLIITGLILVTSKNNATGMPPSNRKTHLQFLQ